MRLLGFDAKKSDALLLCRVDRIREVGRSKSCKLRVRLEPSNQNAHYSVVRGLPMDNSDLVLLSLLADQCVARAYTVADL
jgi:hypothetical protein